jgi:hypothetical protein
MSVKVPWLIDLRGKEDATSNQAAVYVLMPGFR